MRLGFSGTRHGMTLYQRQRLATYFVDGEILEGHHGCCVGADAEFHLLCLYFGVRIVLHPPIEPRLIHPGLLKHVTGESQDKGIVLLARKPYIERNHCIVDSTDFMLIAPHEPKEKLRSGTWATYRYARRTKPHDLILPNADDYPKGKYQL